MDGKVPKREKNETLGFYADFLASDEATPLTSKEASICHKKDRNKLIKSCARLCFAIAKNEWKRQGYLKDIKCPHLLLDFIGEANLACVESIDEWNPKKYGLKAWVLLKVKDQLREFHKSLCIRGIHMPSTAWRKLNKMKDMDGTTVEELSIKTSKSRDRYLTMIESEKFFEIVDVMDNLDVEARTARSSWKFFEIAPGVVPSLAVVEEMLAKIKKKDKLQVQLFERHYALNGYKEQSYNDLASEFKLSRDTVIYKIAACLKKLRREFDPDWTDTFVCQYCGGKVKMTRNGIKRKYCNSTCQNKARWRDAKKRKALKQ